MGMLMGGRRPCQKIYECSNDGSTARRQDVRHIYGVTRLDNLATAKIAQFFFHIMFVQKFTW